MTFFRIFSKFFRKLRYKKFIKAWIFHIYSEALLGYCQISQFRLQIWLLKSLKLSKYDIFSDFFKTFSENLILFFKI